MLTEEMKERLIKTFNSATVKMDEGDVSMYYDGKQAGIIKTLEILGVDFDTENGKLVIF